MREKYAHIKPEQVEALARYMTTEQVSAFYGISTSTFKKLRDQCPEYQVAYDRGKAAMTAAVAERAYELAMEGDMRAIKLILTARGGWSEKSEVQVNHTHDQPTINIYLPNNDRNITIEGEVAEKLLDE